MYCCASVVRSRVYGPISGGIFQSQGSEPHISAWIQYTWHCIQCLDLIHTLLVPQTPDTPHLMPISSVHLSILGRIQKGTVRVVSSRRLWADIIHIKGVACGIHRVPEK